MQIVPGEPDKLGNIGIFRSLSAANKYQCPRSQYLLKELRTLVIEDRTILFFVRNDIIDAPYGIIFSVYMQYGITFSLIQHIECLLGICVRQRSQSRCLLQ